MGSKLRLALPLLAVVALLLIGTTASIAAPGNGNGSGSDNSGNAGQSGNGGGSTPVTICHNPDTDAATLVVDDNAVQAHLEDGEHLGACDAPPSDDEEGGSQDEGQTPDND